MFWDCSPPFETSVALGGATSPAASYTRYPWEFTIGNLDFRIFDEYSPAYSDIGLEFDHVNSRDQLITMLRAKQ
jgi:hypothetical protein